MRFIEDNKPERLEINQAVTLFLRQGGDITKCEPAKAESPVLETISEADFFSLDSVNIKPGSNKFYQI